MFDIVFFVNKDSSKEGDNEEHHMPSNIDAYEGQNGLSFNGCAESVVETVRLMFISWIILIQIVGLKVHCVLHACNISAYITIYLSDNSISLLLMVDT